MWLVRLVGPMCHDRDLRRVWRISVRRSEQERRNLKATTRCEKQEMRRPYHWFSRSAEL